MHVVVALAIGIIGTAYAVRYTATVLRSAVTGMPSSAAEVVAGQRDGARVELHGRVDGSAVRSPISGTPCVWWRVLVVDNVHPTTRTHGVRLDRSASAALVLDDGSGVVQLDARHSTGAGHVTSELRERGDLGREITIEDEVHRIPGRNEWRTYAEHVITAGTRAWAAGLVRGDRLVGTPERPLLVTTTPPAQRQGQRRRNLLLGTAAIGLCPLLALAVYAAGS